MQMAGICVCLAYADARHMDMSHLSVILSFSAEIRKIPVPDLLIVTPRPPARKHKMCHTISCDFFHMLCFRP